MFSLSDAVWKHVASTCIVQQLPRWYRARTLSLTHTCTDQGSTTDPPRLGRPASAQLTGKTAVPHPQGHGQGSEVSQTGEECRQLGTPLQQYTTHRKFIPQWCIYTLLRSFPNVCTARHPFDDTS